MSKTKSPVVCVGGGSNMGLVVEDGEEEEAELFFCCFCFLAAFTLADSTA